METRGAGSRSGLGFMPLMPAMTLNRGAPSQCLRRLHFKQSISQSGHPSHHHFRHHRRIAIKLCHCPLSVSPSLSILRGGAQGNPKRPRAELRVTLDPKSVCFRSFPKQVKLVVLGLGVPSPTQPVACTPWSLSSWPLPRAGEWPHL